jgi:hypothetical protein
MEKFLDNFNSSIFIKGYSHSDNNININIINEITHLIDSVMDMYSIIIIISQMKKTNIIYAGLTHSSNIVYILKMVYNFKTLINKGVTESSIKYVENLSRFNNSLNCIELA